jgi:cytochrome c oxidase subunit III
MSVSAAVQESHIHDDHKPHHQYHLVNPSPWPLVGSFSVFVLAVGAVLLFHKYPLGKIVLPAGFALVLFTMYNWWRDVVKEAKEDKAHTAIVRKGLRLGMSLFILSEVMFFFAFFFSFFHASVMPAGILEGVWVAKPGVWPPEGIETFDPWHIPFMNTLILLLSGTTVTWAHHELLHNKQKDLVKALAITVFLGICFSCLQAYEYIHAPFGFKQGVFASNFYMATGFHGVHVLIGTIFLAVCLVRARKGQFSDEHHLGFEFAAWYWHFVDVVWLFLFVFVYVFGGK